MAKISRRNVGILILILAITFNLRTVVLENSFESNFEVEKSNLEVDDRKLSSSAVRLQFPHPDHVKQIKGNEVVVRRRLDRKLGNLRIACFGYTDTWAVTKFDTSAKPTTIATDGHSMDYLIQRFDFKNSYCSQLGPNVHNYAFPAQGPNYASTCLQSMIKDNVYDAIVIDFPLQKPEVVEPLTKRLRHRFPNAGIFLVDRVVMKRVKLQDPFFPGRQADFQRAISKFLGGRGKRFWAPRSISSFDHDAFRDFLGEKKKLKEEKLKSLEEFQKNPPRNARGQVIMPRKEIWYEMPLAYRSFKEGTESIVGKFRTTPVEFGDEENLEETLSGLLDMYYDDGVTLTQAGHDYLADLIKEAMHGTKIGPPASVPDKFGDGDSCNVWFTTGDAGPLEMSDGVTMVNYQDVRHGLEFASKDAYISIVNPFNSKRTVYISYLTSPGPDLIYSSAKLKVDGINIQLDTIASDDYQAAHSITTPRTVPIGKLNSGSHKLYVEDLGNGIRPFRIVGVSITDEHNLPEEFEFTQKMWFKGVNIINKNGANEQWL